MIRFYYGMSGSFKLTTIEHELSVNIASRPIYSLIKPWKDYENLIPPELFKKSHLNFSLLHLCNLENTLKTTKAPLYLVERGVSDPLYFWSRDSGSYNPGLILELLKKEYEICNGEEIEKILLVQKDEEFISKVILSEPTRRDQFPGGLNDYLNNQSEYVRFTKKNNDISKTIEITNAEEYLNNLGIKIDKTWK